MSLPRRPQSPSKGILKTSKKNFKPFSINGDAAAAERISPTSLTITEPMATEPAALLSPPARKRKYDLKRLHKMEAKHPNAVPLPLRPRSPKPEQAPEIDIEAGTPLIVDAQRPLSPEPTTIAAVDEERPLSPDESTSLLRPKRAKPKASVPTLIVEGLKGIAKVTGQSFGNAAKEIRNNLIIFIISLVVALPNLLNGLARISGLPPELNSPWWNSMTNAQRVGSIAEGASAWFINTILNMFFIPNAWGGIKNIFNRMRKLDFYLFVGLTILFAALGPALGGAAISYDTFLFLTIAAALSAAAVRIVSDYASRLVGINNTIARAHNLLSDTKVQEELVDKLEHVDPRFKEEINLSFLVIRNTLLTNRQDATLPLNVQEYETIAIRLSATISELDELHANLFLPTTSAELRKKYIRQIAEKTYAFVALVVIACPYFITYLQKGFDGVKTLVELFGKITGHTPDLRTLSLWQKMLIGGDSAAAAGMLAWSSALSMTSTGIQVYNQMRVNPFLIPNALILAAILYLSGSSPESTATGIVQNKDNILGFREQTLLAMLFIFFVKLAGIVINSNATYQQLYLKPALGDLTLTHFIGWLNNPAEHALCQKTISTICEQNLFKLPGQANTALAASTALSEEAPSLNEEDEHIYRILNGPY